MNRRNFLIQGTTAVAGLLLANSPLQSLRRPPRAGT